MRFLMSFLLAFSFNAFGSSFYDLEIKSAKGEKLPLSQMQGKPALLVNIATKCGYTPQLDDLEKLSKKYAGKITIIGLPSNDFGGQTPEGNEKVAEFCRLNYGVSFPLTEKIKVVGDNKHPIYKFLIGEGKEVGWNFEKFLVDKTGRVVNRFPSSTEPLSQNLTGAIDKLLK